MREGMTERMYKRTYTMIKHNNTLLLRSRIKKRPHMKKKKVIFYQDNALCHKSMKTMVKLNELGFNMLLH